MSTNQLISTLRLARQTIAELTPDDDALLAMIDSALLAPAAFTIGVAKRPGKDLSVELPSGAHIEMVASHDAITQLMLVLRTYDSEAAAARQGPNSGQAQAAFFAKHGVGHKVSPIQHEYDKRLLKKYNQSRKEILPVLTLADLD